MSGGHVVCVAGNCCEHKEQLIKAPCLNSTYLLSSQKKLS